MYNEDNFQIHNSYFADATALRFEVIKKKSIVEKYFRLHHPKSINIISFFFLL